MFSHGKDPGSIRRDNNCRIVEDSKYIHTNKSTTHTHTLQKWKPQLFTVVAHEVQVIQLILFAFWALVLLEVPMFLFKSKLIRATIRKA